MDGDIRFCTTSDGVRIAYAVYGSGYPIVILPGWISHLEHDWFLVGRRIERRAKEMMVVRYDKRGTGLSDRDQPDMSVKSRTRDLEAVVEAAGLERFVLLGVSEGGPIALNYAATHPERVSHLIMFGSYAYGGFARSDATNALSQLVRAQWGLASSAFTSILLPDASAEDLKAFAKLQLQGASVDDAVRVLEAVGTFDVRPLLPKITAPTLVIHGKQDKAVPFSAGRELAASIPNARLLSFEAGTTIATARRPATRLSARSMSSSHLSTAATRKALPPPHRQHRRDRASGPCCSRMWWGIRR